MKNLGYYNGQIGLVEEMMIPMNDRSNYFGDGIYEACMVQDGIIFGLEEHLDRFYRNLAAIEIPFEWQREELRDLLNRLVKQVEGKLLFLYWHATRGTAKRAHVFPEKGIPSNLLITVQPSTLHVKNHDVKLCTTEDTRFFHCNIKTLNLLPNVMASEKAKQLGCDEAVFHRGTRVTECAHSNLSILKGGQLITAPLDELILPGITRKHMIELCHGLNIPVVEKAFTLEEMMEADEIIVSSTSKLCVRAIEIDGKIVGQKDTALFDQIQDAYLNKFEEETSGLRHSLERFIASGWDLIQEPASKWLQGEIRQAELVSAIQKAKHECGSCGCELDSLYTQVLSYLK